VRTVPWLAAACLVAACARDAARTRPPSPSYAYSLTPPGSGSWILHVEARFEHAPSAQLTIPEGDEAVHDAVQLDPGPPRPLATDADGWLTPSCRERCTIAYDVDLLAMAGECRGIDCGHRVGDAFVGTAGSWLMRPEPTGAAPVHVAVRGGDPSRFVTGLRSDPAGGYVFSTRELGETSYTAFGDFRRSRVAVPGGALNVVLLGGPLAMGDAAAIAWVRNAAGCVASLFGRFPVDATVFVVPVRGADEVVFGRVMSLAGASVALLFGDQTRPESAHSDWVVVHELSHLGVASFVGEGHWLEEGLATYYEPILRERAHWMSEEDLWNHFAGQMPRGVRREDEPASLEERDDIDSTYWGGALFALLADVRARTISHGTKSLDDAMRAALARLGDATHQATVADFLRIGDEAIGGPALEGVFAEFAMGGDSGDLEGLLRSLGVIRGKDGHVSLTDDAPLVAVRKGISTGSAAGSP
jgi:hypothetical protein